MAQTITIALDESRIRELASIPEFMADARFNAVLASYSGVKSGRGCCSARMAHAGTARLVLVSGLDAVMRRMFSENPAAVKAALRRRYGAAGASPLAVSVGSFSAVF